jgi:hypothetical protein
MLVKEPFEFLGLFTKILHRQVNIANIVGMQTRLRGKSEEDSKVTRQNLRERNRIHISEICVYT